MFARHSQRAADLSMVGLSIGPAAIAGLAFATVYWGLASGFSGAIAGGTINQVSQRFGANRFRQLDLAVKQSVLVGLIIMLPITAVYLVATESLIRFFTADAATIRHGVDYLRILSVALVFLLLNLISSRTLAGADDTWLAMSIRGSGAVLNVGLNALFIFGLGMGTAGAALGTVLAEGFVTACFAWGFVTGSVPVVGEFPVRLTPTPPYFDATLTRQLLRITPPLMVQKLGRGVARFPLFTILAFYGPTVVAAFEVGRRMQQLFGAFGAGFSMSAGSLVGQELGKGSEGDAVAYTADIIRFSLVVHVGAALGILLLAPQIARLFAKDPAVIVRTIPFIRVSAVGFIGYGMVRTFGGVLKAAGDNRWAMYGRLVGLYLLLIPLTYLGTVSPLGIYAVYLAIVAEMWSAALISGYRVFSRRWLVVSRSHRPAPGRNG